MLNTKNTNFSQFLTIHIQIMKILLFRKSEVWAFFQILFRLPTVAEEQIEADSHSPPPRAPSRLNIAIVNLWLESLRLSKAEHALQAMNSNI